MSVLEVTAHVCCPYVATVLGTSNKYTYEAK